MLTLLRCEGDKHFQTVHVNAGANEFEKSVRVRLFHTIVELMVETVLPREVC